LEWDETKPETNRVKRGFGFEIANRFEWSSAFVERDDRKDYGEVRYRAFGKAGELKLCIAYTFRGPETRIISVRRMHEKEARKYGF